MSADGEEFIESERDCQSGAVRWRHNGITTKASDLLWKQSTSAISATAFHGWLIEQQNHDVL